MKKLNLNFLVAPKSLLVILALAGLVSLFYLAFPNPHTQAKTETQKIVDTRQVFMAGSADKVYSMLEYIPNRGLIFHCKNGEKRQVSLNLRYTITLTEDIPASLLVKRIYRGERKDHPDPNDPDIIFYFAPNESMFMSSLLEEVGCYIATSTTSGYRESYFVF